MPHTILIADDNLTVQRVASEMLSQDGLTVVTVANGMAAIKKIPALKPLVVLADVDMPGKDGYEVCEFVKAQPDLVQVRVLLAVSDTDPYDPERGERARADGVIKKPFDPQELASLVAKSIQQALALGQPPAGGEPAPVMPLEVNSVSGQAPDGAPRSETATPAADPISSRAAEGALGSVDEAEDLGQGTEGSAAFDAADLTPDAASGELPDGSPDVLIADPPGAPAEWESQPQHAAEVSSATPEAIDVLLAGAEAPLQQPQDEDNSEPAIFEPVVCQSLAAPEQEASPEASFADVLPPATISPVNAPLAETACIAQPAAVEVAENRATPQESVIDLSLIASVVYAVVKRIAPPAFSPQMILGLECKLTDEILSELAAGHPPAEV